MADSKIEVEYKTHISRASSAYFSTRVLGSFSDEVFIIEVLYTFNSAGVHEFASPTVFIFNVIYMFVRTSIRTACNRCIHGCLIVERISVMLRNISIQVSVAKRRLFPDVRGKCLFSDLHLDLWSRGMFQALRMSSLDFAGSR